MAFYPKENGAAEIAAFEALKPRLRSPWSDVFPRDDQPYTSAIVPSITLDPGGIARQPGGGPPPTCPSPHDRFGRRMVRAREQAGGEGEVVLTRPRQLSTDGDGREALRTWLAGYFKSLPDARSDFLTIEQTGAFLSVCERARWTAKDGTNLSQQAHAIYEIRDGPIERARCFPSVRAPAPR